MLSYAKYHAVMQHESHLFKSRKKEKKKKKKKEKRRKSNEPRP
jgi:hypothetical protein